MFWIVGDIWGDGCWEVKAGQSSLSGCWFFRAEDFQNQKNSIFIVIMTMTFDNAIHYFVGALASSSLRALRSWFGVL